jgi:hypothetical protein
VVSAEDERHGVEQEDGRLGWVGHETSLAAYPGPSRINVCYRSTMGDLPRRF